MSYRGGGGYRSRDDRGGNRDYNGGYGRGGGGYGRDGHRGGWDRDDHRGGRGRGGYGGDRGDRRGGDGGGELGMNGAKDSKGLFSPKDWRCTGCGNVNWSKRISCNICNNPKPGLGPQGNREGYGGGFMDREEQVEYRDTRFRDKTEFDEFGRRKRKRNHREGTEESRRSVSEDPTSAPKNTLGEEEDDDGDVDPELLKAWGVDEEDRNESRNGGRRDEKERVEGGRKDGASYWDRGDDRDSENGHRDERHHRSERSFREDDRERSPPRFRKSNSDESRGERPRNRSRSPRDSRNERNRDEREDRYYGKDQGSRRGGDEPRDSRDR